MIGECKYEVYTSMIHERFNRETPFFGHSGRQNLWTFDIAEILEDDQTRQGINELGSRLVQSRACAFEISLGLKNEPRSFYGRCCLNSLSVSYESLRPRSAFRS